MKQQHTLLVGFLLGMLFFALAACGGSSGMTGMNMGGSPAPSEKTGTARESAKNTVQVTETEYQIDASVTSFSSGTSYHFVVTNKGKATHEFMIAPANMMPGMSMDQMDKMAVAMIASIAPGETKTVDVTFPQADTGKSFELACHLPGHYEAGMKLGIKVRS